MRYNPDFDIKLDYGELREEEFRRIFKDATVEIKSDVASRRTGNIYVEYAQKGKQSGIAITKAEYYVIETQPRRWVWIPTEDLKKIARRIYKRRGGTPGGDNENMGVLVPIVSLLESETQ